MAKATEKVQSTLIDKLKNRKEEIADKRHIDTRYNRQEFDLVIGCDYFWKILTHQTEQGNDGSVACASILGWIIFGASEEKTASSTLLTTEFWALEHIEVTKEKLEDLGFL
ncbi:hypothetical protein OUZ56_029527 [Daphnia magna]|uniref:Peptidase aspartic putative domain-containing protein n=1 Tax=Daphnia magna TaxID=35525 RepID=A0ABR0B725_9CRUS|nr:hypothetical protein OUZ56_029527 [Daphnia magna]